LRSADSTFVLIWSAIFLLFLFVQRSKWEIIRKAAIMRIHSYIFSVFHSKPHKKLLNKYENIKLNTIHAITQ
jgi:hypothetical protein